MGNLKFDAVPDPFLLAKGLARRHAAQLPVIMLGISREGEEAALLKTLQENPAYMQGVQWWIVPRHPQRFDVVAHLVKAAGWQVSRRSDWVGDLAAPQVENEATLVLGDSLGEMPFYFAAAHVCLLGGSFEPLGGQNLIEACACGCPVVMGPHTFNFSQAAALALQHDAATRVSNMAEGVKVAYQLATQAESCARASQSASEFAKAHQGALARCLEWMGPWLDPRSRHH
jgi:3-deoxy-D-manno-octulosonic-acid transferase